MDKIRFERKPDDHRMTLRVPKELFLYLNELSHEHGTTVTFEVCEMVKKSMDENAEIMEIVKRRLEHE